MGELYSRQHAGLLGRSALGEADHQRAECDGAGSAAEPADQGRDLGHIGCGERLNP